jgi:F0F1-type ATP synthase membrane subunit c/vacuolar-type H+-ATPase subunit K
MRILKKNLGYVGTALAIGLGLFFSYLIVRGIVDALLGSPAQRTRLLTKPILYVCVLAVVTAYVKLRQEYRGEKSKAGPG